MEKESLISYKKNFFFVISCLNSQNKEIIKAIAMLNLIFYIFFFFIYYFII